MHTNSILVAEPDGDDRKSLVEALYNKEYRVDEVESATAAVLYLRENSPDLMVLDCGLPDLSGIQFLKEFTTDQRLQNTRVFVTSEHGRTNATAAFDAGADDFIAKPYKLEEICSRISVCLQKPPLAYIQGNILGVGPIIMDDISHRVSVDSHFVELGPREYQLLNFFLHNPDRLFSRKHLLTRVWKHHDRVGERTVDVHIRRLRSRLAKFNCDNYIQTIRGEGYRFSVPQSISRNTTATGRSH